MKVILRAGGERTTVELKEAKEILERFQIAAKENVVEGVDLSCRQWKQESLTEIAEFLLTVASSVRILIIDDIIAGLLTEEGLAVTEQLSKVFLESNLLEVNFSDNAMGERGLGRIGPLFQNSNLQRLYLKNCGLSHYSMIQLRDYLLADDQRVAKSLRELALGQNMIGVEGAQVLAEFLPYCKNLEALFYDGCRPTKAGSKLLADGLLALVSQVEDPPIRLLNFNDCDFGRGKNNDDGGVVPLTKALAKCKKLRHLELEESELKPSGIQQLLDALTSSGTQLTYLNLENNEIGEEGAEMLSYWLETQTLSLTRLDLAFNEMSDKGVAAVLVPFFASANVLEDLSLEQNEIASEGVDALLMARLPHLKRLNLVDNDNIDGEEQALLLSKFGKNVVLFEEHQEEMDELTAKLSAAKI